MNTYTWQEWKPLPLAQTKMRREYFSQFPLVSMSWFHNWDGKQTFANVAEFFFMLYNPRWWDLYWLEVWDLVLSGLTLLMFKMMFTHFKSVFNFCICSQKQKRFKKFKNTQSWTTRIPTSIYTSNSSQLWQDAHEHTIKITSLDYNLPYNPQQFIHWGPQVYSAL